MKRILIILQLLFPIIAIACDDERITRAVAYDVGGSAQKWPETGRDIFEYLVVSGIPLTSDDTVTYSVNTHTVIVKTSNDNHELIESLIEFGLSFDAQLAEFRKVSILTREEILARNDSGELLTRHPVVVAYQEFKRIEEEIKVESTKDNADNGKLKSLEGDLASTELVLNELVDIYIDAMRKSLRAIDRNRNR